MDCSGGMVKFCDHDYVVGPAHAICNRCEKVIMLPSQEGTCDVEIDGPGGPLDCVLPYGHASRTHRDRSGAEWTM